MKKNITVLSLDTAKDPLTLQPKQGLVLSFKNENNMLERMELDISQLDAMQMLGVKNLADVTGKQYEIDTDGKAIKSITEIDGRPVRYNDIQEIKQAISNITTILAQVTKTLFPPQQNAPTQTTQTNVNTQSITDGSIPLKQG